MTANHPLTHKHSIIRLVLDQTPNQSELWYCEPDGCTVPRRVDRMKSQVIYIQQALLIGNLLRTMECVGDRENTALENTFSLEVERNIC